MTIGDKVTLLQLAYEGFFLQRDEFKQTAADAIFALSNEIEDHVSEKVAAKDQAYCNSIIKGIQEHLENHFKNPATAKRDAGLEELLAKLTRVAFL